ncbi:MAG: thiol reductant ABC exporter subunit CydC, partial [Chloroflexi bacterium]|nr:thiol reductant ABC exporter subunit CydC [Chloroflexota bacterium]
IAVLQVAIVGVRFFGISRGLLRYGERLATHSVNFRLLARLRVWFYQALEPLAPARLSDYASGDLLSRAVADIETLENFYVRVVAPPLTALLITAGVGWFAGAYHPSLGWVLAGGLLVGGTLLPVLLYGLSKSAGDRLVQVRGRLNAALVDTVQGIGDLLAFGAEGRWLAGVQKLNRRLGQAQGGLILSGATGTGLYLLLTNLTLWVMLVVAIPLVRAQALDGVTLAVLALVTLASFEAVTPLGPAAQFLQSSLRAARRLFAVVDAPAGVKEPLYPAPAPAQAVLAIRNLTFAYAPNLAPALQDFNLQLEPGKRVALVGPSGAGKSTLVHLLLRFWDYESGEIRLDGRELSEYAAEEVRRQIAVISPAAYFFSETLRQNLLLARPEATDEELRRALAQVELQDWLASLPAGLDSWVGQFGLQMSGGERQRLAAARALLQPAPILALDEPTAYLDLPTARRLAQTLKAAAAGRALLWITHRLVEIEDMDEIVVLAAGQTVERGRHADLLKRNGFYARLWRLQHQTFVPSGEL